MFQCFFIYGNLLKFAESVLADGLHWDNWYDNQNPVKPTEDDDKKVLYENKLLGVPRLRQVMRLN